MSSATLWAGGIAMLGAMIAATKLISPGKGQAFPSWQGMQYMRDQFSGRGKLHRLDNDRYPDLRWTTVAAMVRRRAHVDAVAASLLEGNHFSGPRRLTERRGMKNEPRRKPAAMAASWLVAAGMFVSAAPVAAAPVAPDVRLYTLDCGRIDFADMGNFSDTGDHDGEHGAMPVTCFLIKHGTDWMLWDAGLGDEIAASPTGRVVVGLHFRVSRTLASQLAELHLKPDDVRYVGLSHLHADHSGNAALFPHATFLVSPLELAWARDMPTPDGVRPDVVAAVSRSKIEPVTGEKDVFHDGSVRLLSTPGHTPGHHSLMVQLPRSGWVILTGDVAHFQVNYDRVLVPLGNASRAETVASIERVKGLASHYDARVVVQHAADVLERMPRFPAYLN